MWTFCRKKYGREIINYVKLRAGNSTSFFAQLIVFADLFFIKIIFATFRIVFEFFSFY